MSGAALRALIERPRILVAPGVYDALSALLAEQAGAEAVYLSGAGIAHSRLGMPDIGLVSMAEVRETLARVADRVGVPVIADADTGFGNALNVQRTVREFERAGAAAIQLEDQGFPKRCGHLDGKGVISEEEMAGKVRAALDARRSEDTLIIARTDACATEGLEAAIERAFCYGEEGADILFVDAPTGPDALKTVADSLRPAPVIANMVEGGKTPPMAADSLQELGYAAVIFPGGVVRANSWHMRAYYGSLLAHGSNGPFAGSMLDFEGLNSVLGTGDLLGRGAEYSAEEGGKESR